jgi:hypothetical protein
MERIRYVLLGMVSQSVLAVTYTLRGERIRIISARPAEPFERRLYHEKDRKALERRHPGQDWLAPRRRHDGG